MADVFAPQPVKTKANGDVVAAIVDAAGANKAAVSAAGALKVDNSGVTQPVSGTVTSNVGTTNGLALDTSVNAINTSHAASVTGVKGPMVQGTATTTAPTYTTATVNPLSLTVAGALRTDASATTQPVSGTVTANAGTGTMTVGQATGTNLHAVLDTGSTTAVTQATGTNLHTVVDSGSLTVTQATGTNLHVVVDGSVTTTGGGAVGTVADNFLTSAAVAAGATVTLDSTSVASGTGHLTEATVSSSVALKAQLGTWNGTTFTVKRTFFVAANSNFVYLPSRSDQINLPTGATATYRWSITNNDNANAADVYASTTYQFA